MGGRRDPRLRGQLLTPAIIVAGTFRLPPERMDEARPAMAAVVAASNAEAGCLVYAYAEDVTEPGLIRVHEAWASREALDRHFAQPHMADWQRLRQALGFSDRAIVLYEVAGSQPL